MTASGFGAAWSRCRADGSTFAAFLTRSGMDGTARISSFDLEGGAASALPAVEDIRRAADQALARVLPEPEAGLASGILVGRRDRVARDVVTDFATTGLSHVVAISGWNIAVVAGVVGSLLLAAGVGRRGRSVLIIVVICVYTLLAGGGASVVRAALMCGVALLARESGRPGSAATALGLAVWGLLLLDPTMATDVGFQLSVAATAGLLAWGSRVTERLRGRGARTSSWLAGGCPGRVVGRTGCHVAVGAHPLRPPVAHLTAGQSPRGTPRVDLDAGRRGGVGGRVRGPRRGSGPAAGARVRGGLGCARPDGRHRSRPGHPPLRQPQPATTARPGRRARCGDGCWRLHRSRPSAARSVRAAPEGPAARSERAAQTAGRPPAAAASGDAAPRERRRPRRLDGSTTHSSSSSVSPSPCWRRWWWWVWP